MTRCRSAAWAIAAWLATSPAAGTGELLSTEPADVVPMTLETRLVVRGIEGEIYLGQGAEGQLRYASMTRGGSEDPIPIALSREGQSITLSPVEGTPSGPRFLQLALPDGVAVSLRVSDTLVRLQQIGAGLDVQGSGVTLSGFGIAGPLALNLDGGTVEIRDVAGDVAVHGTNLAVKLAGTGAASFDLNGGTATVEEVRGKLTATLAAVEFRVERVRGPATIRASGGSVFAGGFGGESTLVLKRTPAGIRGNTGAVSVTTDADLKFSDAGPLHVDSLGGAVTGSGAKERLEVRSQGPLVDISEVNGQVSIQGNGLTLRLKRVWGETDIESAGSDIAIESAFGALEIDNDSGSISVLRASGPLDISGKKSVVRLEALSGPLQLAADGPQAEVAWVTLPLEGESVVQNDGGGIVATLPTAGACRVEARATFGRVDSEVPGVAADDTGKTAAGEVGKGGSALIRFVANGDIHLLALKPPPRRPRPSGIPTPRP